VKGSSLAKAIESTENQWPEGGELRGKRKEAELPRVDQSILGNAGGGTNESSRDLL